LRSTAAWPSSGDVAVNLRPTGTYKSTTDPSATLSLDFTSAARAPNASRWLIWRRDPAYNGRAVIANPDGSTRTSTASSCQTRPTTTTWSSTGSGSRASPSRRAAGSNGASTGVYLESNSHHFEFRNFQFDGFRQTNAANFESVEGSSSRDSGPLLRERGDPRHRHPGSAVRRPRPLTCTASGILVLNVLAYKMDHGFAFQFYDSGGGVPERGDHLPLHDRRQRVRANGGTIILPRPPERENRQLISPTTAAQRQSFRPIGSPGSGNNGDHLLFSRTQAETTTLERLDWTNERTPIPTSSIGEGNFVRELARNRVHRQRLQSATDLAGNPRRPGAEDAGAFQHGRQGRGELPRAATPRFPYLKSV
jgi:hypothetical protein